jgi:hypothetical protein
MPDNVDHEVVDGTTAARTLADAERIAASAARQAKSARRLRYLAAGVIWAIAWPGSDVAFDRHWQGAAGDIAQYVVLPLIVIVLLAVVYTVTHRGPVRINSEQDRTWWITLAISGAAWLTKSLLTNHVLPPLSLTAAITADCVAAAAIVTIWWIAAWRVGR